MKSRIPSLRLYNSVTSCSFDQPMPIDTHNSHPPSADSSYNESWRAPYVNAAFLHEIKEDDVRFRELASRLRASAWIRPFYLTRLPSLAQLLADFRDQLAFHFALEEAYGYFDDALVESPHLSAKASSLRGEHSPLYERACFLAATADDMVVQRPCVRSVARLRRKTRAMVEQLEAHERGEIQLIQEAANVDLGVVD